jgi:hypothetical protein
LRAAISFSSGTDSGRAFRASTTSSVSPSPISNVTPRRAKI